MFSSKGYAAVRTAAMLFAAVGAVCLAPPVQASEWPDKPVRLIVGYPPGGSTDAVARVVATGLQEQLGQSVIVENRPGASTQIATEAVMRAPNDGYTLTLVGSDLVIQPSIRERAPWNALKDFTPVALIAETSFFYIVRGETPVTTLPELQAYAKKNAPLTFGSSGVGSHQHLVGEQLHSRADMEILHVPYQGGSPALQGLLSGQVDVAAIGPNDIIRFGDRVRAIANAGNGRHPLLPDVPTAAEQGFPTISGNAIFMLAGPAGLPEPVTRRLVEAVSTMMENDEFKKRIFTAGSVPSLLTGEALAAMIASEEENWRSVAQSSKLSLSN